MNRKFKIVVVMMLLVMMMTIGAPVSADDQIEGGSMLNRIYSREEYIQLFESNGIQVEDHAIFSLCDVMSKESGKRFTAASMTVINNDAVETTFCMAMKDTETGQQMINISEMLDQQTSDGLHASGSKNFGSITVTAYYNRYANNSTYYYQPYKVAFACTGNDVTTAVNVEYRTVGYPHTSSFQSVSDVTKGDFTIKLVQNPSYGKTYTKTSTCPYYLQFAGVPSPLHRVAVGYNSSTYYLYLPTNTYF